jgi:hypothetical protein
MSGFTCAIFYVSFGIPIARHADSKKAKEYYYHFPDSMEWDYYQLISGLTKSIWHLVGNFNISACRYRRAGVFKSASLPIGRQELPGGQL